MTYAHEGEYKSGDRVVYHAVGGSLQTSVGIIKDIITHPEVVGDERPVTVKASENMPRYVIENVNTGKETAYKYENLVRKAEEGEGVPGTMGIHPQKGDK